MLKLKLQYFGHLMWRTDSFEKTLMLGKIEGRRRSRQQRMRWLDGITNSWVWVSLRSWWWTVKPGMLQSMGLQWVGHDWATELTWKVILTKMSLEVRDFISLLGNEERNGKWEWTFLKGRSLRKAWKCENFYVCTIFLEHKKGQVQPRQ